MITGKDLAKRLGVARSTLSEATKKGYLVGGRHDVQSWAIFGPGGRVRGLSALGLLPVTIRRGAYPHTDSGVEVRRVFHKLRSVANENFNEQFKAIFNGNEQVPTKGLAATARYALGAVLVYQLVLWHRHEQRTYELRKPENWLFDQLPSSNLRAADALRRCCRPRRRRFGR